MKAQEFAIKNKGRRVRIKYRTHSPNPNDPYPVGRVIGHTIDNCLVLELEKLSDRTLCRNAQEVGFVQCADFINRDDKRIWLTSVNHIRFLRKIAKAINPYPNSCKKCHSPARISKNFSMCSNTSCSVNKKQFKAYYQPAPKNYQPAPKNIVAGELKAIVCSPCNSYNVMFLNLAGDGFAYFNCRDCMNTFLAKINSNKYIYFLYNPASKTRYVWNKEKSQFMR